MQEPAHLFIVKQQSVEEPQKQQAHAVEALWALFGVEVAVLCLTCCVLTCVFSCYVEIASIVRGLKQCCPSVFMLLHL